MAMRNSTTQILIDTSYLLALSFDTDEYYQRAAELSYHLDQIEARLIVTRVVLVEVGNALSRRPFRAAALHLLDALERDPSVDDEDWGLADCVSFVVMEQRGITDVLTADRHFFQAGYRALLLESA